MSGKTTRRDFCKRLAHAGILAAGTASFTGPFLLSRCSGQRKRPNILFCISDDQSYLHTSANGCRFIHTPAFDRVAREGILFKNAFVATPSCNPSRSSILTGMPFYRLREASMNHTPWPEGMTVYTDLLEQAGYYVGHTGKGCGPTDWRAGNRTQNPAGKAYNQFKMTGTNKGIGKDDYARNFKDFLEKRPEGTPFCFWYGGRDPHRVFKTGIGLRESKKLKEAEVPPIFPDTPEVRSDLLDYAVHIEWFDFHLGQMLSILEEESELENTLVIVTSDNGMAFPRAKATCYDTGTRMPLAVRWGNQVKPGRVVEDFVSFTDFAPTILEAAGVPVPDQMTGKSLIPVLRSQKSGEVDPERDYAVFGVERHFPGGREGGWGYPIRAIRTRDYLYIQNLAPERWPVGDPDGPVWPSDDETGGFGDTDGSPTKTELWKKRDRYPKLFELAFGKRPAEELYKVKSDPYQLNNLAENPELNTVKKDLADRLENELRRTQDPRILGKGELLDAYARKYISSL